jgi:chromosome partitioning protein
MTKTIAIANQKGGVGKTTTTVNLGAALAERGSRVLLIDFDPQSSLSLSLGVEVLRLERSIYDALMDSGPETSLDAITRPTSVADLFLAPSSIELARAEPELLGEMSREYFLKNAIRASTRTYDFILIDCSPSLGILTTNALAAADQVLVPVQADYLAFRGADLLIRTTVEKVRRRLNPQLELAGVLVTMFNNRTTHAKEVLEEIRATYGEKVFHTVIKQSTRVKEAPASGEPLLRYDPHNALSQAYRELAQEIETYVEATSQH